MRVLVAVMVSIMLCLQPMISLEDKSTNYEIVSFSSLQESSVPDEWWKDTNMDKDKNRMHDMLDIAIEQGKYVIDGKISVLVDFDHMPTEADEQLLIDEVGFDPSWRFHHIPIISGMIDVDRIGELLEVEGEVAHANRCYSIKCDLPITDMMNQIPKLIDELRPSCKNTKNHKK